MMKWMKWLAMPALGLVLLAGICPARSADVQDKSPVDIAAFARTMTWDPACREINIGRVEEFPAEHVFPGQEVLSGPDGLLTVPVWKEDQACIGLEWLERRDIDKMTIQFARSEEVPEVGDIRVEVWHAPSGRESRWQGQWLPLGARIHRTAPDTLTFDVHFEIQKDEPTSIGWRDYEPVPGFMKVRFMFPARNRSVRIKTISAYTRSHWREIDIALEKEKSGGAGRAEIEVYNGRILSPAGNAAQTTCTWDTSKTLTMRLDCSQPQPDKSDRTLLWLRLPETAFAVAVEDLITHGCVYVPHAGVFLTNASDPVGLSDYRARIAGRKTVLERVHEMPDQTLAGAMKAFNDIQNYSPTFLALACHNRKFQVRRSGVINYGTSDYLDTRSRPKDFVVPQFGARQDEDAAKLMNATSFGGALANPSRPSPQQSARDRNTVRRHLHGGWMPIQVLEIKESGLLYTQRAFVAPWNKCPRPFQAGWTDQQAMCISEFVIENPQAETATAELALHFLSFQEEGASPPRAALTIGAVRGGAIVIKDGKLGAFVDIGGSRQPLALETRDDGVVVRGRIEAGTRASCTVYIPGWDADAGDYPQWHTNPQRLLEDTEAYWNDVMADTTQIDIPDKLFENIIKASVMYLLATARSYPESEQLAPWAAAWVYGPIENEAQVVVRAMDLMNRGEFSRRCLNYYLSRYNDAGALTTGYTLMGTGWNLWTVAEHFRLTRDRAWFQSNIPVLVRACEWIVRQCEKTKALDARGNKVPEYGLFPPGVTGDWSQFGYRFYLQAHNHDGLGQMSELLAEFNYPGARALQEAAAEFRQNILRAYKWAQERNPVLAMPNGTWLPPYPAVVDCYGRVSDMHPSGNRAAESYDVEHGSQHLAAAFDLLDPQSKEVDWMVNHLEDVCFLFDNRTVCHQGDDNQRNWFDKGGFSKYQPAHSRIVRIHGLRDDVKAVIRAQFNEIPGGFDSENLSFWEHPCATAAWNKTHTTARILAQSRQMFVMEKGRQLWLAPFVPNHYLEDGQTVSVKNAPTYFGQVSYALASSIDRGFIQATIDPPTRNAPEAIIVRLRHPRGKLMRSVFVNGEVYADFDSQKECVQLKPAPGVIKIRAEFDR